MSQKLDIWIIVAGLFLLLYPSTWVDAQTYKVKVPQEGIYKISQEQAHSLGLGDLDGISAFGSDGMLDQRLDSSYGEWNEIPGMMINGELFFYLPQAHKFTLTNSGAEFHDHLYTDTLTVMISGANPNPKRIQADPTDPKTRNNENKQYDPWYFLSGYKESRYNILNSGRTWYGHRLYDGGNFTLSFPKASAAATETPIFIKANLLAQSLTESQFTLHVNGSVGSEVTIPSIPNSTYGIKGREGFVEYYHHAGPESTIDFVFSFQTSDRNGAGYLKDLLIAQPVNFPAISQAVLYRMKTLGSSQTLPPSIDDRMKVWELGDGFDLRDISESRSVSDDIFKIAVFDPATAPLIEIDAVAGLSLKTKTDFPELLVITSTTLLSQANRLAQFKNSRGISASVVNVLEIYDAFGYGNRDITAIRNFLAYQFHAGKKLKNVLFFGKGTFDYKGILEGNPNHVPTYSSRSSLNPLTSYSSDDYYGFLELGDGYWEETNGGDHHLSIGIGRIPATNLAEAQEAVNKIIAYSDPKLTPGDWKRRILLIADDGDNNIHLRDAESHASFLLENHPEFVLDKLYLDRFEQINTGSSQQVPEARAYLDEWVEESGLLINYIGHGNETNLTAEGLFRVEDIQNWPETDRLPVFVTATCEFGRHDSPLIRSGAEMLLFAKRKGAIGLLTTGRPVFSSVNFALNKAFIESVFSRESGEYLSLGEIFRATKNNSLNGPLNRNFSLLGDPSLPLSLPPYGTAELVFTDIITDMQIDTLQAKQRIRFEGKIVDPLTQAVNESFNGEYKISLSDKPLPIKTQGDESDPTVFLESNTTIHQGKGEVSNGLFSGELIVSKNINYNHGAGTVKIYAQDTVRKHEAFGADKIMVGGTYSDQHADNQGPAITYLVGKGHNIAEPIPSTRITLVLHFQDASGINISPMNLGQDITLTLNDEDALVLNHLYQSLNGSFEEGELILELSGMREGENRITISAFDNLGNRSEVTFSIQVEGSERLQILSATTYPNPATTLSLFKIRHNKPGENLLLLLRVFSTSGREIFSTERRFVRANETITDLEWIFSHDKTKYPIKGTYIYQLELRSEEDGASERIGGKIIIK